MCKYQLDNYNNKLKGVGGEKSKSNNKRSIFVRKKMIIIIIKGAKTKRRRRGATSPLSAMGWVCFSGDGATWQPTIMGSLVVLQVFSLKKGKMLCL